jgi:hypothetical protein
MEENPMTDSEWKEACFGWYKTIQDLETIFKYGEGELRFGNFRLVYERATIPPVVEHAYKIIDMNESRVVDEFGDNLEEAMSRMVYLLATSDIKHLGF